MNSLFKKALATLLFAVLIGALSLVPVFAAVPEAQAVPTMPAGFGTLNFVHNLEGSEADMTTPWPYEVFARSWGQGTKFKVYLVDVDMREIITPPNLVAGMREQNFEEFGGESGTFSFVESASGNHFLVTPGFDPRTTVFFHSTVVLVNLLPGQELVVVDYFKGPLGPHDVFSAHIFWSLDTTLGLSERATGYTLSNIQYSEGGLSIQRNDGFEITNHRTIFPGDTQVGPYFVQASATWTRGEVTTTPMAGTLTKNLAMPPGVSVLEDMDFAFNFEPVPSAAPAAPNQTAPALVPSPVVVTAEAGQTSAELNLVPILEAMIAANPSLHAGTVDWIVSEIDTAQAGVTYDTTSQFRLRVHLANQEAPTTGLRIAAIEAFSITPGVNPGDDPVETKIDGIAFTNVFTPDTGTITDPALVVSKVIAGDRHYANLTTDFTFTVTLTPPIFDPPLAPPHQDVTVEFDTPLIGTIMPGNVAVPFTINAATGIAAATFDLRDGQRLEIPTLPAGTTFSVLEAGTPNFAPSAIVTEAGIAGSVQTPPLAGIPGTTIGQDLTVSGIVSNAINTIVVDGNDVEVSGNAADFTNAYNRLPITGLVITNVSFIAVLSVLALAMILIAHNRRRIERMPLA